MGFKSKEISPEGGETSKTVTTPSLASALAPAPVVQINPWAKVPDVKPVSITNNATPQSIKKQSTEQNSDSSSSSISLSTSSTFSTNSASNNNEVTNNTTTEHSRQTIINSTSTLSFSSFTNPYPSLYNQNVVHVHQASNASLDTEDWPSLNDEPSYASLDVGSTKVRLISF